MAKFCAECGKPLNKDLTLCPNCGMPVVYDTVDHSRSLSVEKSIEKEIIPHSTKRKKPLIKKLGFFSWILLFIGSAIGLYALFTPAGSVKIADIYSWDIWMFGYNIVFESGVGFDVFWTLNENLLTVSLMSTIFVIIGNIAAIVSAVLLIKRGVQTTYVLLIAPIVLVGSVLFYLAGYQVLMFLGTGESFWSLISPAFAIYGQFLAALFMISGFFIARGSSKYIEPLEKEAHQEKVYNMLKGIIESKFLLESEKDRLNNELEVISLRLKGVAFLQRKIEFLAMEKPDNMHLEDIEYEEGLRFFQQAFELSSISQQEISKTDLNLVKKIGEQQDQRIALHYLNEISDHTTILIGEILKRVTS